MDHDRFRTLITRLYTTVKELEEIFPGRNFTPDGHMVGSIGECLVSDAYDLELKTASNKGYDAVTKAELEIEIKATQSNTVAFRGKPLHTIVIKILPDGTFEEIYNGPGKYVWDQFEGKPLPRNGQYQISLTKLRVFNQSVAQSDRVPRVI